MSTMNRKTKEFTHEGAPAKHIPLERQLARSVMNCLLWEKEFYEEGEDIAARIFRLAQAVKPEKVAQLAIDARHVSHLRHVPLLLICGLMRGINTHQHRQPVGSEELIEATIEKVVSRADEMGELISVYWSLPGNKHMIPHAMQRGLQRAIVKFDEYQLAKYDRDSAAVRLRDVLRLVRPVPGLWIDDYSDESSTQAKKRQAALWKRAVKGELKTPDTWEVALSSGANKKETFERLLTEGNLGYFALLRNLRNMVQAGVDDDLVRDAILARKNGADRILPFRFIAAARAAPVFERELDQAMMHSIAALPELPGRTIVLVDVSGSMDERLSAKSDLKRIDAAAGLAGIVNCEKLALVTFSHDTVNVPPRRGMAAIDAIVNSQPHAGTYLGKAMRTISHNPMDRLIVITDEQSHDPVPPPPKGVKGYMINVASARCGVGYGAWNHIDGFSENVLRWIHEYETSED